MGKKEIKKDEIKREEIKRNEKKREERNREQIMGNETDRRKRKGKEINRDKSIQKIARMRHWAAALAVLFCLAFSAGNVQAASFGGDYRYWSQGGSDYRGMREVGCLITAQAKMLYEANVNRDASFNPDAWYNWLLANGGIASSTNLNMRDHKSPVYYANSRGKNLEYLGYWNADDAQLWFNINAGYYTIVHVSGTNTGGSHFVLLDNALSKQTGVLYCYDSFSDRGTVSQQKLTRYSIHNGGHVYKGYNSVHTHSYAASVTTQPTCTQAGVRTYRCSCGASYTEAINAKGHQYAHKAVAPTLTEKGYTTHTCSACGHSYTDSYVEPPKQSGDGWYYSTAIPQGVSEAQYEIQYQNYYEKIQQSSPGAGWTNAGTVKNEWQNTGNPYTSVTDLPTSDARVLVRSVYYHFCGPYTGKEGNYEQTGKFVHYDEIASTSVTARYLGTDNGHPYYYIDWIDGGGRVWCKSGVSCDGSYGSHGNRCCAWYKMNTYQDRTNIAQCKFTKTSDWLTARDASASAVKVRFKQRKTEDPEPDNPTKPENPSNPENPTDPVNPGNPENPTDPTNPSNSETPTKPENPTKPEPPTKPENPTKPVKPQVKPKATVISGTPKAQRKAFQIKWKKQSGITGYQVQYSTDKKFRKNATVSKTLRNAKLTKLTVKKLKPRKTYYIRIRTYKTVKKTNYFSSWSKIAKVKTKR